MPKSRITDSMPIPTVSRRSLAGGAAALLGLAGAATAAALPSRDTELLDLCAKFQRLHGLSNLEDNENWEAEHDASWKVSNKIADMVPVTEAGHRAKAAVAVAGLKEMHEHAEVKGDPDAIFALKMLRDWLGGAGA